LAQEAGLPIPSEWVVGHSIYADDLLLSEKNGPDLPPKLLEKQQ
jgi:hypothetical protein